MSIIMKRDFSVGNVTLSPYMFLTSCRFVHYITRSRSLLVYRHYCLVLPATALLLPVSLLTLDALGEDAAAKPSTLFPGCSFAFSSIHRWVAGASAIAAWHRYVRLSMSALLAFFARVRSRAR